MSPLIVSFLLATILRYTFYLLVTKNKYFNTSLVIKKDIPNF